MTARVQLDGRRALLVEDESLVSLLIEDILVGAGCQVDLAMRLADALDMADGGQFDFAILDVNLGGEFSFPVAQRLRERNIPFLFSTGYTRDGIAGDFADIPMIQKPYVPEQLLACAAQLIAR